MRTAIFLSMAASATAIQLSSLQSLPSNFIGNPGCVSAYETSITQCTSLDLKSTCSEGCQKALDAVSTDIILACRQATIPNSASILKAAMSGGSALGEAVCGSQSSGGDDEEEEEKPTSTKKTEESTQTIGKSTSAAPEKTADAGEEEEIVKDEGPAPTAVNIEDDKTSNSGDAATQSPTGATTLGGDPFSEGAGDQSGAGRVIVGLVMSVVVGAVGLIW